MRNNIVAALVIVGFIPSAEAAWFCSGQTAKFAEWRTSDTLSDVNIGPQSIIYQTSGYVVTCGSDNTCSTNAAPPPNPGELIAHLAALVAKYKAKVVAMHEWADGLSDSCLRDGYNEALKEHDRRVREDEEALDFLKNTPEPLAPTS